MERNDLEAVLEIERLGQPSPWTAQILLEELARDWARIDLLREGDVVLGFCNYWFVHDEVHLLNIGTHPEFRRQGVASALLLNLIQQGKTRKSCLISLEVRRSNAGAISLYQHFGFKEVGVRVGYYAENREDALVMLLDLAASVE